MSDPIHVIEYNRYPASYFGKEDYDLLRELCAEEDFNQILSMHNNQVSFKNYAGVFQLKSGTYVEVLPKICFNRDCIDEGKEVFVKMIKCLKSEYYKSVSDTNIDNENFPLLEVFINLFLNEIDNLIRKGIRKNYVDISENSLFIKGRIKVNENIRYNSAHKEKTYIEYSDFIENIPENKIIKKTLALLSKASGNHENIKRLRRAAFTFDNVDMPFNVDYEFEQVHMSRLNLHYQQPLDIAKVFLKGNSFIPLRGENNLISLLFPLNRLFEDYVAVKLRKKIANKAINISTQESKYYLTVAPNKKFKIKPDIVIRNKETKKVAILDTKWKLLDQSNPGKNYDITQADMYQLYAYGKKYQKEESSEVELFLIYPMTERFDKSISWTYEDGLKINLLPFNLNTDCLVEEDILLNWV